MNIIKKTLGALMAAGVVAFCSCGPKLPELPIEDIRPYFADAAKTKAIDTAFYQVKDAKGNLIGTVLFSSPYSDEVEGFNGPTPLLIIIDADGRIKEVDAVSGATYTSNGVKNSLIARLKAYQKQRK